MCPSRLQFVSAVLRCYKETLRHLGIMSVAPSLAPSTVDGSKLVSRRGSNGEEAEAVSAVLVLLREKTEESVVAYHPNSSPAVEQGDGAPRRFVAVLAPSSKAALATLLSQPPGTYLLVNEEDAAITVYVKFRQAVRAVALVKGKELKKQEHSIDWSNPKTQDTPIHRLYLGLEAFSHVEHCWKRFLPQVQAIVFELCCEPYLDEDVKLEDWVPGLSVPPSAGVCSAALMPNDFGFYLLATLSETRETAVQVRQVEFDFKKSVVTIADGSVKPSVFLLATNFATKRTFEPEFTQQSGFQNCIELSVNDPEVVLLSAVLEGCDAIVPNEPLPETFVAVLSELHTHFATMSLGAGENTKPMSWPPQKLKMVSRIIPVILELMVASAACSEAEDPDLPTRMRPTVAGKKKSQLQVQFARVLRFDLLFLALRSDDAVICRLVHQVAQLLGAPNRLPSELVELVRDLTALSPLFLRLFLRSQGTGALWKSLRSQEQAKPAAEVRKSQRSLRDLMASAGFGNALQTSNSDLKTSLFGKKTTAQTKSRKSLLLVSPSSSPTFPSPKPLAFARFSPSTIHLELGTQFELPEAWSNAPTVKSHAFCCCDGPGLEKSGSPGVLGLKPSPKTACSKQTSKMSVYELILQLSLRFLYDKTAITNWDRDVALLLRLDALHDQLFHEIASLARKKAKMTDEEAKTPISCRLRVVITCLSTLCRLEMKRRRDMSSAIGDKKFWAFLHLSRDQIRDFNANLRKKSTNTDDQEGEEEEGVEAVDDSPLVALIELFQWLPKAILTEWLVLSLTELLQMLSELNNAVKTATKAGLKERNLMVYTLQLLQVLRLILERTSDGDLQTVLIRALASDSSAIVSLLRFVLSTQTSSFDAFTREYCVVHRDLLQFLTAFVRLDLALPTRNDWDLNNRSLLHNGIEVDEDAEVLEQKKDELLMTLLAPDLNTEVESTEDESPGLWAFILGLMFPSQLNGDSDDVADFQGSEGMSGLAVAFRSTRPPELLTEEADDLFLVLKAFLLLQQALYTSQEPDNTNSPVDYDHCIASHLYHIEQYSDRITANAGQEDPKRVRHLIALHLRCLVVLASRRSQSPGIQQAFDRVPILPSLLQRLLPPIGPREMAENPPSTRVSSDSIGCEAHFLPPLKLPSLETGGGLQPLTLQPNFSTLSLGLLQTRDAATSHFLVAERDLHVLAIVLVASYALLDANLELDEAICPRVSVPGPDSQGKSDLLWTLQQHLAVVELDQRCFERLMVELEAVQAFVNASRVSAIRLLLRFLCPNRFDREMYTTPIEMASIEHDAEASKRSEYVAKGAFATVYRSQTAVPRPAAVAVKSLGHQKRAGELCPVSGLYNEVAILKKLRGEKAATQILDFGNHHAEKSFEIIMELCPNSLSEWRRSFARAETPFRSCVILILRAFAEICCCLTRIHRAGVCHFDIKVQLLSIVDLIDRS
ncbi:hypothetical protein BBJ28_00007035 [Nothophytophthora sp. Chile5]|nr:hypothetical protein BBJ28_00007035 [Nothophytophthora sp. Chile5]